MNLQDLNNPNKIDGILLWNNGKPLEIGKGEDQGFQEYPKSIELWQIDASGLLRCVKRWLKKSITHYVINNEFHLKN